jgi:hypothetical protein
MNDPFVNIVLFELSKLIIGREGYYVKPSETTQRFVISNQGFHTVRIRKKSCWEQNMVSKTLAT